MEAKRGRPIGSRTRPVSRVNRTKGIERIFTTKSTEVRNRRVFLSLVPMSSSPLGGYPIFTLFWTRRFESLRSGNFSPKKSRAHANQCVVAFLKNAGWSSLVARQAHNPASAGSRVQKMRDSVAFGDRSKHGSKGKNFLGKRLRARPG